MGIQLEMSGAGRAQVVERDDAYVFERQLAACGLDALRLARFLGRDPHDSADVVQEASILAWRYRKTLRGEWKPWFLAIVRRVAHRPRRTWILLPAFWQPASDQPDPGSLGTSQAGMLVSRLPRRQRAAIWLRYDQDLSYEDVGRILGVSEAAAKMLAARARATLKGQLGAYDRGEGS